MIYIFSRRTSNCIDRLKNILLKNKKSLFLYIAKEINNTRSLLDTFIRNSSQCQNKTHNTNALHIYLNLTKSENQF